MKLCKERGNISMSLIWDGEYSEEYKIGYIQGDLLTQLIMVKRLINNKEIMLEAAMDMLEVDDHLRKEFREILL